jgi:WXG100 family type VII secretion target
MADFAVRPDDMLVDGDVTISSSETVGEEIKNIRRNKEDLVSVWSGEAADTFYKVVDEQTVKFDKVDEVIRVMGEKIKEGANNFIDTEEENVQLGNKLLDEYDGGR